MYVEYLSRSRGRTTATAEETMALIGLYNQARRKRRREWNEHVARMGVERLVKIFRNNVPEERIPGGPERSSDLIKTGELAYNKVEDWSPSFFSYSLKVLIPILFIFCFFARFIDHEEILKYTNRIEWF